MARKNHTRRTHTRKRTRKWKKDQPSFYERGLMLVRCGKKCFLGPKKSFPICTKKTCDVNLRGVQAAYIRARQWKHHSIAKKAKKLLNFIKKKIQTRK